MDNNIYIAQGVLFLFISLICFLTFKFNPTKYKINTLVIAAMLSVISVSLSFLSIMVPLFGVPSLKIGFSQLPLIIGGFILSPPLTIIMGLVTDLLGLLLVPTNFPFLGFTLNNILLGLIPALLVKRLKLINKVNPVVFTGGLFTLLILIASGYIISLSEVSLGSEIIQLTLMMKIGLISGMIIIAIGLCLVVRYLSKQVSVEAGDNFALVIFIVVLMEILINLCLTPLWLNYMYGIPYLVSLFVRVIKVCLMIPINITIIYLVLKVIKKIFKNKA